MVGSYRDSSWLVRAIVAAAGAAQAAGHRAARAQRSATRCRKLPSDGMPVSASTCRLIIRLRTRAALGAVDHRGLGGKGWAAPLLAGAMGV